MRAVISITADSEDVPILVWDASTRIDKRCSVNGDEARIGERARLSVTKVISVTVFGGEASIGEGIRLRIAVLIVF